MKLANFNIECECDVLKNGHLCTYYRTISSCLQFTNEGKNIAKCKHLKIKVINNE